MKKITSVLLITLLALSFSFSAGAYDGKKFFHVGLKGSLILPHVTIHDAINDIDLNTYEGFNAGVAFQLNVTNFMTIQPEVLYQQYTMRFEDVDFGDFNYTQGDIIVPVNLQFGWNFFKGLLRPYGVVSPFVGCSVVNLENSNSIDDVSKTFQYGVGLGVGVDIWRFQVQFKYNWSFAKTPDQINTATQDDFKTAGAELSVAFFMF